LANWELAKWGGTITKLQDENVHSSLQFCNEIRRESQYMVGG